MTTVPQLHTERYVIHSEDIPETVYREMSASRRVAWDLETTGLNWATDRIALCQLQSDSGHVALVRLGEQMPARLARLLADPTVKKVFHHAMFDLRFMAHHWEVQPRNITCTKIAAKLLFPEVPDAQRLQSLLQQFLGVTIDKAEQKSTWTAAAYTPSQVAYAVRDVIYLFDLLQALTIELDRLDLRSLAEQCFAHIPTRVELELKSFGDVFTY